ncbi:hypothetical protein RIF29_14927 [Crotalaria pallida]|uniref:DUF8039 domain-containing protein n=1 Tax=Crotalaria pallida TaxID=3830 RepID=A0AAN9IAR6_CROPI
MEESSHTEDRSDSLTQSCSSQGTELVGKNDILTTALGRPEHSGRVRTAGKGVGHRQYWGASSSSQSISSIKKMVDAQVHAQVEAQVHAQVEAQVEAKLQARVDAMRAQLMEEVKQMMQSNGLNLVQEAIEPHPTPRSTKGSNNVILEIPNDNDDGGGLQPKDIYNLYVEEPDLHIVARANVYESTTIHSMPIPKGFTNVVVVEVIDGDAEVPHETDEVKTVGEALKSFILWPTPLVKHSSDTGMSKKPIQSQDVAPEEDDELAMPRALSLAFKLKRTERVLQLVVNKVINGLN